MEVTELLLSLDAGDVKLPTKNVEIKRLSDLAKDKVIFKIKGLTEEEMKEIRETCTKFDGKKSELDSDEFNLQLILKGTVEPSFKDKSLCKHYGVKTPYDLINKLLSYGEILSLGVEIGKLSGINDEEAIIEVKN